jgi:hypothetical protein
LSLYEAYDEANEALEAIARERARSPYSIYTGDMEEALERGSRAFRLLEAGPQGWYAVRRLYTGVHVEFSLLGRMASALRIRMHEYNTLNVSGLDYFHWRLDKSLERARRLLDDISVKGRSL